VFDASRLFVCGKGGFGEVWAGKWQRHMDVAVKIMTTNIIGITPHFTLHF
jgi:hypothetical protein